MEEGLAALAKTVVVMKLDQGAVTTLAERLKSYAAQFDALASLLEEIGLGEKSGL